MYGAKTDGSRYGVEKRHTLHKEKIGAKDYIAVMFEDGCRDRCSDESGRARGSRRSRGFSFDDGDVGPVDDRGSLGVVGSHWAVANQISLEYVDELCLVWASNFPVQIACGVGGLDFAPRKHAFLGSYCGDQRVTGDRVVNIVRLVDVKARRVFRELHHSAVSTMNDQGGFRRRVHGDATYFSNISEGQNIGNGLTVVPNGPKVGKLSYHVRVLVSAVSERAKHMLAVADVAEVIRISKHGNGRL